MIKDSDAHFNPNRMLSQHQAALTLLQPRASDPATKTLQWLDLACGRGQIIAALDKNMPPKDRAKIRYYGYDIKEEFVLQTTRIANNLAMRSVEGKIGDLSNFNSLYDNKLLFDFISLTNTVHEVDPGYLAALIIDSLLRLKNKGTLFVYDMEKINPPELGAVPWRGDEMQKIIDMVLETLGAPHVYRPGVGVWQHSTCTAWNVIIDRKHLRVTAKKLVARRVKAVAKTRQVIQKLLENKLDLCRKSLASLTTFGEQTSEEKENKLHFLYEYWAVSRALEHAK